MSVTLIEQVTVRLIPLCNYDRKQAARTAAELVALVREHDKKAREQLSLEGVGGR